LEKTRFLLPLKAACCLLAIMPECGFPGITGDNFRRQRKDSKDRESMY